MTAFCRCGDISSIETQSLFIGTHFPLNPYSIVLRITRGVAYIGIQRKRATVRILPAKKAKMDHRTIFLILPNIGFAFA